MPTFWTRIFLFLSSYVPLFFILSVLLFHRSLVVSLICGGLCVVSPLVLFRYLHRCRTHHQRKFARLQTYQRRDNEVMSYIVSYIVPFATLSLDLPSELFILGIFLFILLILYINSNMIYINPLLNIFKYHLYEIETEESERSWYYLARKRPARGETIYYVHMSDDIWLETK